MEKSDEAIVLKTQSYGESDKLVTLFLKKEGKRRGIAKGGLVSKKRFGGGLLEMGSILHLVYKDSPHKDWLFLKEATPVSKNFPWRASWATIVVAGYALELAFRLLPEGQEALGKFNLLKGFLSSLREEKDLVSLHQFEFSWLSLSGWHPDLERCGLCEKKWNEREETDRQAIFDHYWDHILGKPPVSRRLLEKLF